MPNGRHSEREAMVQILASLSEKLALLRENLEDAPDDDLAVWMDDSYLYMDTTLPEIGEDSLDLSMQAGRLLVTAAQ